LTYEAGKLVPVLQPQPEDLLFGIASTTHLHESLCRESGVPDRLLLSPPSGRHSHAGLEKRGTAAIGDELRRYEQRCHAVALNE
jgi:hypothetical protein